MSLHVLVNDSVDDICHVGDEAAGEVRVCCLMTVTPQKHLYHLKQQLCVFRIASN